MIIEKKKAGEGESRPSIHSVQVDRLIVYRVREGGKERTGEVGEREERERGTC